MEYLGTMLGHGKPITRKGTKKSGLTFTGTCPDGEVGVLIENIEGVSKITIRMSKEGKNKYTTGTFNDFFFENGKIEG